MVLGKILVLTSALAIGLYSILFTYLPYGGVLTLESTGIYVIRRVVWKCIRSGQMEERGLGGKKDHKGEDHKCKDVTEGQGERQLSRKF